MTEIHKKTFPDLFEAVANGSKPFDLRVADFVCQPGDVLILDEVDAANKNPTGRSLRKKVGYVLKTKELDFYAPEDVEACGYQVIGLSNEDIASTAPMRDMAMLRERARTVRQKYNELNKQNGHGAWGGKEYVMGFVGDVGDLVKIVMAKESLRRGEDSDEKLAHELSDCLWSVLTIADHYGIDVEKEFMKTMDELEQRIVHA